MAVFVPFGTGNNGKTTLLSTFLLQSDVLIARQESNNTQADPAGLRGALFVMTSETEEGQRLSQGKLKRITEGTGKIKATRNYENRIKYPETHKLWMDTNSKPMVRAADDQAIFNRCIRSRSRSRSRPRRLTRACRGNSSRKPKGILAWPCRRVGVAADGPRQVPRSGRRQR